VLGRQFGGLTNPTTFIKPAVMRGYYCQQNTDNTAFLKIDSFPTGTSSPYSLVMADSRGLITATTTLYQYNIFQNLNLAGGLNGTSSIVGTSTLTGELGALAYLISTLAQTSTLSGDIQGAVNIAATLAGNGDLSGALGALISILADLNGNGDLTGSIASALSAVAALSGSGDLTGAIQGTVSIISSINGTSTLSAVIIGNWDMIVSFSGIGNLVGSSQALASMISSLVGSGTIYLTSGAVTGNMDCDIILCSELSPTSLAEAVWASALEGTFTAAELMRLLTAVAAGQTTIIDLGGGAATVTFRDINNTTDRVVADMQDSERITVTKNL
jgi:hypothetical protein